MRLLIVEDNQRLRRSVKLSLEESGYICDEAADGEEGQDLAELTPYDAIILDIMLPKRDGLEVCRNLRNERMRTPILLLTARDAVEDRVKGLDSGADDYLVKPFSIEELEARLHMCKHVTSSLPITSFAWSRMPITIQLSLTGNLTSRSCSSISSCRLCP